MSTTQTSRVLGGGRYQVGALLGRGGMADVYEAVDTRLGRPVAVKILRPEMVARPDVRRRFEDEARAAARLSHPNVVAVFDTGEDEGSPWIVMERLSGETLGHRMLEAKGPMETRWTLRVATDVLSALSAAHAAGIVHRDVKPGNILFSDDDCAKVADFGIAKSIENVGDGTTANVLLGTPRYLPPERIEGGTTTAASDIYAVGVLLYEALSGQPAFEGDTPISTAYAVQHTTPTPLSELRPDLPASLVAVVERAMQKDPALRFATAREMGDAVAEASELDLGDGVVADADSTVVIARDAWAAGSPDPTSIVGGAAIADATTPRRGPLGGGLRLPGGVSRELLPVLVLGAIILLVLLAAALSGSFSGDDGGGQQAGSTNTAAAGAKAPPSSPLTDELRQVATRVQDGDGPAGAEAASRLRAIADKLDRGDSAGADATALAADVVKWDQERRLGNTASDITLAALAKVPGVAIPAAAPAPAPAPKGKGEGEKKGEEKGDKDD